jgi:hypothetical protein
MKKYIGFFIIMMLSMASFAFPPSSRADNAPPPKVGDCLKKVIAFEKHIPDMMSVAKMSSKQLEKLSPHEREQAELYDYKLLFLKFRGCAYLVEDNSEQRVVSIRILPPGCLVFE